MENVTAFQVILAKVDTWCFQGQGNDFGSANFDVLKFNLTENFTEKLPATNAGIW